MNGVALDDARTVALPPAEPGTAEWHAQRAGAIGGSEAAACCGLDPYESPLALYLVKTGVVGDEDNESMAWGRRMEEPIAAEWAERSGLYVVRPTCAFAHVEHEWMHANVDRFVFEAPAASIVGEPLGIVEVKFSHDAAMWADDRPPDHHVIQVQHCLAVTGMEHAWLVGAVSTGHRLRLVVHEIERDDLLIARLIECEADMMRRIDEGDPPAASAGDSEVLAAAFAEPTPGAHVELPPGARYVLDDLDAAKARMKRAKADVDRNTNQLRVWLGDAEVGMLDGDEPVTWKGHDVTRLDAKRLRAELPEVFVAYSTTAIERRLLAKQRKE